MLILVLNINFEMYSNEKLILRYIKYQFQNKEEYQVVKISNCLHIISHMPVFFVGGS